MKLDADGLVPVIAQEARTGMVRMLAWANRDALAATLATGAAHFWSRSRQASWHKGETSGNTLAVREVRLDCDGDVVLYLCDPDGSVLPHRRDLVLLSRGASPPATPTVRWWRTTARPIRPRWSSRGSRR